MKYLNPHSQRKNIFDAIYNNPAFIHADKNHSPSFPLLVDVELTNVCNLQCIFCGQQTMQRKKGFMEENLFKKIVNECAIHDTPIRFIRYGEPFLHRNIISYVTYVKSKNVLLHITNNGLMITEEHMKALVNAQLDSLIFSFQGVTQEGYEIMRNNKLHEVLSKNILKMVEIRGESDKPYIHISTTITDEPQEQVDKFVHYWGNIVDSVDVGKTNLSTLDSQKIQSIEIVRKLEELKKHETIKKIYRPCKEVYRQLSFDWNGKVTCCCGDFDEFLLVGTVENSTIDEIWNHSKELKLFRGLLDCNKHRSLTLCSNCYFAYDEF